jgi:hypothetical protein
MQGRINSFEGAFYGMLFSMLHSVASEKTYPSIWVCCALYFWSYTLWKLGFVASPETSQNQVFRVKTS